MCNVPDYGVEEVSDHAVAMMLALSKKLPVLTRRCGRATGIWKHRSPVPVLRVHGGLVGFGRIPQLVAKKLKGFGVAIQVCDPYADAALVREYGAERWSWTSFWRRAILSPSTCR